MPRKAKNNRGRQQANASWGNGNRHDRDRCPHHPQSPRQGSHGHSPRRPYTAGSWDRGSSSAGSSRAAFSSNRTPVLDCDRQESLYNDSRQTEHRSSGNNGSHGPPEELDRRPRSPGNRSLEPEQRRAGGPPLGFAGQMVTAGSTIATATAAVAIPGFSGVVDTRASPRAFAPLSPT